MIAIVNEGYHVTIETCHYIKDIAEKYFSNKPFVYVSHRMHQYSIDPNTYVEVAKIKNLVGVAIVSHEGIGINNVALEKRFFPGSFKDFLNLKDARVWIRELLPVSS
jgi:dihydrodipicolinate synthase/N-acetylneuraminate lyase